jgi:hypothetical protein
VREAQNHTSQVPGPGPGQILSNAEQIAKQWLQNPSCQKLFGSGLGNPSNVLNTLLSTGSFSSGFHQINFTALGFGYTGEDGLTLPQFSPFAISLFGGLGTYLGLGAQIYINTSAIPTYKASGAPVEFAEAILEE